MSVSSIISLFLKNYKPFSFLSDDDVNNIAYHSKVEFVQKLDYIFKSHQNLQNNFFVIYSGLIHFTNVVNGTETLTSKAYTGDLFGLRPFFAKGNYSLNAMANEDVLLISIPFTIFKTYLIENISVMDFLLENFVNQTKYKLENFQNLKTLSESEVSTTNSVDYSYLQDLQYNKNPLTISSLTNIRKLISIMAQFNSSYAVITHQNRAVGLITDAILRNFIASPLFNLDYSVNQIMNTKFIVVNDTVSIAEAQLNLVHNDTNLLLVTEDGTENGRIKGVITERDIIYSQANDPGIIIQELKKCFTIEEIILIHKKYLQIIQNGFTKNIPLHHLNTISGEVLYAIMHRCIQIAIEKMGNAPVKFVWLSIGSQGRKEQLTNSDQDHFLIFEDVEDNKLRDVKYYFIKLAQEVVEYFKQLGYIICPNEHVSSNIHWCNTFSDTLKIFNLWINNPKEITSHYSPIFFDFEYVFGDIKIKEALETSIYQNLKDNKLFFDFIGNQVLKLPRPLTFFKKIDIDDDGKFKDKFNLKEKAIMHYIDAARLFALSNQFKGINNTYFRWKQMAITDEKNADIYLQMAENYITLYQFRVEEGIKNDNDGTYLDTNKLNKTEKEKLKQVLNDIDDLEQLIKDKFQLTQFS